MTQFPLANAATIGSERPVVVLNSELVRLLDDDGRRAVLAHEAATCTPTTSSTRPRC